MFSFVCMLVLLLALVVDMLCCMYCCEIASSAIVGSTCRNMEQSYIMYNIPSILVGVVYHSVRNWWLWMLLMLWVLGVQLTLQQLPPELSSSTESCVCELCGVFVFVIACAVLVSYIVV